MHTKGKSWKRKTTHSYVSREGTGQLGEDPILGILMYCEERVCQYARDIFIVLMLLILSRFLG